MAGVFGRARLLRGGLTREWRKRRASLSRVHQNFWLNLSPIIRGRDITEYTMPSSVGLEQIVTSNSD